MDFAGKIGFESKYVNACRCCLQEDGIADLNNENNDSGDSENYDHMLKDTFKIQISHLINDSTKRLICSQCITSLQEAFKFKQKILQSVQVVQEYLKSLEIDKRDIIIPEPQLRKEPIKIEELCDTVAFDIEYDRNEDSFDDDEILANLKQELRDTDGATLPKRKHSHEMKSKSKKCKIRKKLEIVSQNPPEKDWSKISERRGTGPLLRENSLKLIQNSTICVFQWNKSRYRCFCCKEPFSDINLLKEHTDNAHTLENIEKRIILQQNRLVKVEISSLHCKLCREKLENMSMLKQHLSKTHGMNPGEDLLVPFKIESELKCQICFEKFSMFRLLNIHMNKHYQKQVCHICGAGFSNLVFLNLHRTRSHRPFSCKTCNITFNSRTEKKQHDVIAHNVKYERKFRFPCPFCPQRFFQENLRVRHLVDNHGMPKPDYKCTICLKSFLTKSLCNNHVKNVHNKEKVHECDVCHTFFYTKSDVVRHSVTHTGDKKYSCGICNNLFATKDSLRRHMKRTHSGVQ